MFTGLDERYDRNLVPGSQLLDQVKEARTTAAGGDRQGRSHKQNAHCIANLPDDA
jgi:hypothetical protein